MDLGGRDTAVEMTCDEDTAVEMTCDEKSLQWGGVVTSEILVALVNLS